MKHGITSMALIESRKCVFGGGESEGRTTGWGRPARRHPALTVNAIQGKEITLTRYVENARYIKWLDSYDAY